MTYDKIIIAGFGGQGALNVGKMIAEAGLTDGKEVSWLPSYGSEMRGGTANCCTIVSDQDIASPTLRKANFIAVLNRPSLIKFESWMEAGGNLVVNTSLIEDKVTRDDINVYYIPANKIAEEVGNPRGMNMVILGTYVAITGSVTLESIDHAIDETFSGRKAKFAPLNKACVRAGIEYIRKNYPA